MSVARFALRTSLALLCYLSVVHAAAQAPLGTAFTYQGQLQQGGSPLTGTADLQFRLWDAASGGGMLGSVLSVNQVDVVDGAFSVELDFGTVFNGEQRFLEVSVRAPAGAGPFTSLTPRQAVTGTPYALQTRGLYVDDTTLQSVMLPTLNDASGLGVAIGGGVGNMAAGNSATIGGGSENTADGTFATVGGGRKNSASGDNATVAGGVDNVASGLAAMVPGGSNNEAAGDYSFAGGDSARALHNGSFVWADQRAFGLEPRFTSTDEDQFLIRARGGVGIGTSTPIAALDVAGDVHISGQILTNAPLTLAPTDFAIDQAQNNGNLNSTVSTVWQSFTPSEDCLLQQFEFRIFSNPSEVFTTMRLYEGEGTGGTFIEQFFVPVRAASDEWVALPTNSFPTLKGGTQYTVELFNIPYSVVATSNNLYPGGRAGGGVNVDLAFRTYTKRLVSLGVGRATTTNALEVEGNASKTVAGSWLANSDRRIKTDVAPVTGALDKLDEVRLVSFAYTEDYRTRHPSVGDGRYLNVIAQEFAEVFPDHVRSSGERLADGSEILQVDTYPLTIYAAAAIQELRAETDKQLEALQRENVELKQRLARLEAMLQRVATKGQE